MNVPKSCRAKLKCSFNVRRRYSLNSAEMAPALMQAHRVRTNYSRIIVIWWKSFQFSPSIRSLDCICRIQSLALLSIMNAISIWKCEVRSRGLQSIWQFDFYLKIHRIDSHFELFSLKHQSICLRTNWLKCPVEIGRAHRTQSDGNKRDEFTIYFHSENFVNSFLSGFWSIRLSDDWLRMAHSKWHCSTIQAHTHTHSREQQ